MRAYDYSYEHHCCGVNVLTPALRAKGARVSWEEFIDGPFPRDSRFTFYQIPIEYEDYLKTSWARRTTPWWIIARTNKHLVVVRHGISRAGDWRGLTKEQWDVWKPAEERPVPDYLRNSERELWNFGWGHKQHLTATNCLKLDGFLMTDPRTRYGRKFIEERVKVVLDKVKRTVPERSKEHIHIVLVGNQIPLLTEGLEKIGFKTLAVTRNPGTRNRLALLVREPDEN